MNKWQHIEDLLDRLKAADDRVYRLSKEIGLSYDSLLLNFSNDFLHIALESLALLAGDNCGWIEWYYYECECGKKPMEAGIDGDMRLIDSVEKLRWLIELKSEKG